VNIEYVLAAACGLLAVGLYSIGFIQLKRAFPERANWLITQCFLAAVTASVLAYLRGYGVLLWTAAPAIVASIAFIAGRGSVPVLIHEADDQSPMPQATADARRRFGIICVVVFVVGLIVSLIVGVSG
jgi:hypothetical protein